ncbi:lysophospholipid acyltransferase family protein [Metabacillus idriensis]|uniref:lysophospholipid acyltransferase family protein n=1 Tax=Metabacillus idriensis TaxID=324768 RepID=UPI00281403FD|nr:lysophospholipid acyltransferase family protein [Metabacillus idriensis]MDR0136395.1 lysophospholipid acyltransferase family protein [Metabacillus idriensis]
MIEAAKNPYFEKLFFIYNRMLFKRHFNGIYTDSCANIPDQAVICMNHSTWWDGLLLFHCNQTKLKHDIYIMMHEKGLIQFPFFKKLGAFSVNRDKPKDIVISLQYANTKLGENKSVCLFPQGDEKHIEKRPLGFLPGAISLLEKKKEVPILPVLFFYSFGNQKKQDIFVRILPPLFYDQLDGNTRKEKNEHFECFFTKELDVLKQQVMNQDTKNFVNIL